MKKTLNFLGIFLIILSVNISAAEAAAKPAGDANAPRQVTAEQKAFTAQAASKGKKITSVKALMGMSNVEITSMMKTLSMDDFVAVVALVTTEGEPSLATRVLACAEDAINSKAVPIRMQYVTALQSVIVVEAKIDSEDIVSLIMTVDKEGKKPQTMETQEEEQAGGDQVKVDLSGIGGNVFDTSSISPGNSSTIDVKVSTSPTDPVVPVPVDPPDVSASASRR